jgi:hypothetical protein
MSPRRRNGPLRPDCSRGYRRHGNCLRWLYPRHWCKWSGGCWSMCRRRRACRRRGGPRGPSAADYLGVAVPSDPPAAGGAADRSQPRLDLRTRVEVMRLADRGRRHREPAVSLSAYEWASGRLRTPLWRELLIVAAGGAVGLVVWFAVLLSLNQSAGLVIVIALGGSSVCGRGRCTCVGG